MFKVPRTHAHYIGYLSWALVAVATAALLLGIFPSSQGFQCAGVSFAAIVALRYVARMEGRSE